MKKKKDIKENWKSDFCSFWCTYFFPSNIWSFLSIFYNILICQYEGLKVIDNVHFHFPRIYFIAKPKKDRRGFKLVQYCSKEIMEDPIWHKTVLKNYSVCIYCILLTQFYEQLIHNQIWEHEYILENQGKISSNESCHLICKTT